MAAKDEYEREWVEDEAGCIRSEGKCRVAVEGAHRLQSAWAPVSPFRRNRSAAGPRSPPARREATGEILFNNKTDSFMSCYSHVEHNKSHRHGRSQYITRTLILDDKTRRTLLSAPSATNAALDRC